MKMNRIRTPQPIELPRDACGCHDIVESRADDIEFEAHILRHVASRAAQELGHIQPSLASSFVRQALWRFHSLFSAVQIHRTVRIRLSPAALTQCSGASKEVNMRRQTLAVLMATVLAGGSTVALAQGGQGHPAQVPSINQNQSKSSEARGRTDGASRFSERAALRRQLRQTGFQNIRILDTAFLVQALTQGGRPVVMILSPREGGSAVATSSVGTSRPADASTQRPQQFGAAGTVAPGLEQALDLRELNSPMVNPGLVEPGQMREYLQSRGFSDISNLRQDGSFFTGTAQWRGRQVSIRVDARNGLIVEPEQYLQSQFRQSGLR
jgi:hypothetical protein